MSDVAWLGVRPENISIGVTGDQSHDMAETATITGTLSVCEYLGSEQFAYVDCGLQEMITVRVDPACKLENGTTVGLGFGIDDVHFFNSADQRV